MNTFRLSTYATGYHWLLAFFLKKKETWKNPLEMMVGNTVLQINRTISQMINLSKML